MDRRTALRNLALVIGGAALLPACSTHDTVVHYKHFDASGDQQALIKNMAETIIPKTSTPGATDLNLDKFVWLMVDDCTKKKDQKTFFSGMTQFNQATQKLMNKSFADCNKKERETVLNAFEQKNNIYPKDLLAFYGTVKGLTVFGYTESKYFMTQQVVYELVPGRYNAYFPASKWEAKVKHG